MDTTTSRHGHRPCLTGVIQPNRAPATRRRAPLPMSTPPDPTGPLHADAEPPAPRRRAVSHAAVLAAVLAAALLVLACATLPARPWPALKPLAPAVARSQATLLGAQGPVTPAQKARDLAGVEAEGRAALVQHHLGVLAAQGALHLYRGNAARLLVDGPETFAAMKAAIAQARHRVLVESYIVEDVGVAAEIGDLLLRKAAEGVFVAMLYDSVGSFGTDRAFFDRLRAGGVRVCAFNPVNPLERPGRWGLLQRNHRKMLAVDSDVAYTGGINLSDVYASGSFGSARRARQAPPESEGWRDTQVELRGAVVAAMALLFHESWLAQDCLGALPPAPAPLQAAPGQRVVKLVAAEPAEGINPTYTALLAATDAARRSVHLTMAYFAPGPEMVKSLGDAARRGVDVVLVLPGRSDVRLVVHAARSYYAELLAAGVQIHEVQHAVMHAKTAVIDGVFSTVGSSNLDWRSITGNHEIDVIVLGDDFGQALERLFRQDLERSQRIDPAQWPQRGAGQRLLETLGRLMEPVL